MKPSAIILDLLRTYPKRGTSVKTIMATGALFGLSENVVRVNLSRLVNKGVVENFERGHYRLTDHTDPLNDFVEEWRLGERRVRQWDGESWNLVHLTAGSTAGCEWSLTAAGFREVSDGLWVRPDNLVRTREELRRLLGSLGLDDDSVLAGGAHIDERCEARFLAAFDLEGMSRDYRQTRRSLEESMTRLDELPLDHAMKESFALGGTAVHILAKDPLLPDAFLDTREREALWKTMLVYDKRGRDIWGRRDRERPETIPTPQLEVSRAQ